MLRTKKMLVPALLMGSALAWTVNWQASANAQIDGGIGENLAVVVQGTATGEMREIDGVMMDCFDVDLVDAASGRIIGRGTDCLDLNSIVADPSGGAGFSISNTTFFHLPGGTIKSRNRTTIQPVLEGSPGITHLTGDMAAAPNILGGTERYQNAEGTVQLNGAVDMSRFGENIISFNCVLRINLSDG